VPRCLTSIRCTQPRRPAATLSAPPVCIRRGRRVCCPCA
jgi:hypothetical protein